MDLISRIRGLGLNHSRSFSEGGRSESEPPFTRRKNGSLRSLLSGKDIADAAAAGTMSKLPPKHPSSSGGGGGGGGSKKRLPTTTSKPEFSIGTRLTSPPVRRGPSCDSLESDTSSVATTTTSKRSSFGLSPSFARRLNSISFRTKKRTGGTSCHSCGASPMPSHRENQLSVANDDVLSNLSGSMSSLSSFTQQLQQLPPLGQLRSYQPLVSHSLYRPPSSIGSTPIPARRTAIPTVRRNTRKTNHTVSTTGQPVEFRPSLFLDPNQGKPQHIYF